MVTLFGEEFNQYISTDCDRLAFLQAYLKSKNVQSSVVPVNGKRHLYVNFPLSHYNPLFKIKTVICHYDRVPCSPGANDNSAVNFMIANFAQRLMVIGNKGFAHNVRIFFTDGEELGEKGVFEQGAFGLAELFHKCGITKDDVYVFDGCGRGTVPILARTGFDIKHAPSAFKKQFLDLYSRTQDLLRIASPEKWMSLPVPYSDNAGFLALGIPAVAITMLPEEEATFYFNNLSRCKNLEKEVMNASYEESEKVGSHFNYEELLPLTWRLFHTEYDNVQNLTAESIDVMTRILNRIAEIKTVS